MKNETEFYLKGSKILSFLALVCFCLTAIFLLLAWLK